MDRWLPSEFEVVEAFYEICKVQWCKEHAKGRTHEQAWLEDVHTAEVHLTIKRETYSRCTVQIISKLPWQTATDMCWIERGTNGSWHIAFSSTE